MTPPVKTGNDANAAAAPRAHNQALVYDVLSAVSRAHAEGRARTVERYGFTPAQAEKIARLSAHQLHRLANTGLNLFDISVDGRRLDHILKSMRQERAERALQNRLLMLGAPAELMQALYGWSHQEVADRRRSLNIAGADSGRPRRATEVEEMQIWKSWHGSTGMTDAERFETVASETNIKLNVIWAQIKRWRDSGRVPNLVEPEPANDGDGPVPSRPDIRELWRRLNRRPDTEHEQALMRLAGAVLLFGYVLVSSPFDSYATGQPQIVRHIVHLTGVASILISMLIVAAIVAWPATVVSRRIISMVLDVAVPSVYLWYQGEYGVVHYVMYFWIIIGHGFRFGHRYLVGSTALVTLAFTGVISFHPYWQQLGALPYGLITGLLLLPIWAAILLHSKTESQRRAQAARLHYLTGLQVGEEPASYGDGTGHHSADRR
jgi:hypothetical protein